MAVATATATSSSVWTDGKKVHVIGSIAIDASPDTYSAGGLSLDLVASLVDGAGLGLPLPGISQQPLFVRVEGIAGYKYEYDRANKKLIIRGGGGVAAHTHDLFLNNGDVVDGATTRVNAGDDLLGANTGSDITVAGIADTSGHGGIVQNTATITAAEELAASAIPVGVSGDMISFYAIFDQFV